MLCKHDGQIGQSAEGGNIRRFVRGLYTENLIENADRRIERQQVRYQPSLTCRHRLIDHQLTIPDAHLHLG